LTLKTEKNKGDLKMKKLRRVLWFGCSVLLLSVRSAYALEELTITGNKDVADVALRGNDFGAWNYGRGILLEAGHFIGLYDTHPGASLMRFNVSGLEADKVASARLRIYKPRSMSQQGPVEVSVYKVSQANGDWVEGGSASQPEPGAVSWRMKSENKSWAGAQGCSEAGVDYELPALGETQTVYPETSGWIEFNLPAELVQSWIDTPELNCGLVIRAQEDADLTDEAYFFSSEHPSGKGPQLIIEATPGPAKTAKQEWAWNPPKFMPPVGCPEVAKWKEVGRGRYQRWATGPEMHLSDEQGLWPYYWDTQIRVNTLAECFIPLAKSLIRLQEYIEADDRAAFDEEFEFVRQHLLKYEDVKGMRVHQSGPVAEELSSIQLGTMLGKEKFGVHAGGGIEKYPQRSTEEILKLIDKELKKLRKDWKVSDDQWDVMEKHIRLYEGNRWHEGNMTGKYMRETQALLAKGEESEHLFVAARKLFYHHKLYVYWLSDFNTPKWNLWMNIVKVDPKHVAQEFLDARDDNYQLDSYEKQIERIREYYWYPPILYVNPVDETILEGGFGTREWPFKSVEEAVEAASDGTEIRVAGKMKTRSVKLRDKNVIIEDGYNSTFNFKP
jgi:hypothetical protein